MIEDPKIQLAALGGADSRQQRFQELVCENDNLSKASEPVQSFLETVFEVSPYLFDCASREVDFLVSLLETGFDPVFGEITRNTQEVGKTAQNDEDIMQALRIAKRRVALLTGLADLGGWWHGAQVTLALSQFASASLSATIDYCLLDQHRLDKLILPHPDEPSKGSGMVALGMGKLGAGELNYSSDVDIILFHDEMAPLKFNTDDPITLLNRMAKKLIKIMQERTPDGYVFRTDLRLRPDPSSTPLVIPVDAALNYYEGQGQNWERSAMIKAKPVAGDIEAGDAFLQYLTPFVWRKYLDYAAINDVHSIKRQIHAHKGHGEIAVYGHNVKLGRGGIREIEFFAQTQQLIAGGRNPELRVRETTAALDALVGHGWLEDKASDELKEAYWYLRALEHRIQMVNDEQTHLLPKSEDDLRIIAAMMGEDDLDRFETKLRSVLETVEHHYANLFEEAPDLGAQSGNLVFTGDDPDPGTIETLERLGYARPLDIIKTVKAWHVARVPALRANQARELLTELVPLLLTTFAEAQKPDEIVFAFDNFVAGLPAGIQLFSIIKNNPELANLLVRILDAAPKLAEEISRKPHVFDAMLEPMSETEGSKRQMLSEILENSLSRASEFEMKLDAARLFARETRFQIGVRYFSGQQDWYQTTQDLSDLAEIVIAAIWPRVVSEFETRHGKVKGSRICILAMGRLGSRELTASSDLDLIFLYDCDEDILESDGEKPLAVTQYFMRLMQRFIAAMSAPTAEGILYSLDFRLRPSGNAGPLATQVDSFYKYQRKDAWVWEAQALTRARPVFGDTELSKEVSAEILDILQQVGQNKDIHTEIPNMRARIAEEKESSDPWQVKTVAGGFLDLEFMAQGLVLEDPLRFNGKTATRDILTMTTPEDLNGEQPGDLVAAYDLYSEVMNLSRICLGERVERENFSQGFSKVLCEHLEQPDIDVVEALLKDTQQRVRTIFDTKFGNNH